MGNPRDRERDFWKNRKNSGIGNFCRNSGNPKAPEEIVPNLIIFFIYLVIRIFHVYRKDDTVRACLSTLSVALIGRVPGAYSSGNIPKIDIF